MPATSWKVGAVSIAEVSYRREVGAVSILETCRPEKVDHRENSLVGQSVG